jgi:predicted nucleic acid-binding protein
MTLYAETSALLSWFFGEARGREVRRWLDGASAVVTSELTAFELERGVIRNVVAGRLTEAAATRLRASMTAMLSGWSVVGMAAEVFASGRRSFPKEPVRALDAIHLGTLLVIQTSVPDLHVLSLDDRVRDNARLLGLSVLPT